MVASFDWSGERVVVTGGAGFLGSYVVEGLRARGAGEVIVPRSRDYDLVKLEAVRALYRDTRPTLVLHLAARVGGIGANRRMPGTFFYTNMTMGLHLLEACRQAGTEKILVVGTVCSYPKFCPVPFREEDIWEGFPEETNAPYGVAKKALMVQLQSYRQEFGMRGIFLIPVNLYGPQDRLDLDTNHVIPALVRRFLTARAEGRPYVEIWGTGKASREFLYVEDAARGLCDALQSYEDPDPVNLGTGTEISIRDLALRLRDLTGFQGELRFNSAFPDGQPRRQLDVHRAQVRFGWTAQVGLEEGLAKTVAWAKEAMGL